MVAKKKSEEDKVAKRCISLEKKVFNKLNMFRRKQDMPLSTVINLIIKEYLNNRRKVDLPPSSKRKSSS